MRKKGQILSLLVKNTSSESSMLTLLRNWSNPSNNFISIFFFFFFLQKIIMLLSHSIHVQFGRYQGRGCNLLPSKLQRPHANRKITIDTINVLLVLFSSLPMSINSSRMWIFFDRTAVNISQLLDQNQ